jgi:hypothetical protein
VTLGSPEPKKGALIRSQVLRDKADRFAANILPIIHDLLKNLALLTFSLVSILYFAYYRRIEDEEIASVTRGVQWVPVTAASLVFAYHLPGLGGDLKR